jgi:hypothetical protein
MSKKRPQIAQMNADESKAKNDLRKSAPSADKKKTKR